MDTLNSEDIKVEHQVSETALRINHAFMALPLAYKRYVMFGDYILLLADLKAGTDYSFLGNTYSQEEFEAFKTTFSGFGLRLTEPHVSKGKSGESFRQGYVYNPRLLEQETKDSDLVLPYKQDEALEAWVGRCEQKGIPVGAIYGKLYSFPESAIRHFLTRKNHPMEQENQVRFGNETYFHSLPAQADVVAREDAKTALFSALEANPTYQALNNSPELQQSIKLFKERSPAWTRTT